MIPYDDLVAQLQSWRARQGLPVAATHGAPVIAAIPGSGPTTGSGPRTAPPPAPPRTNPPAAPPSRAPMPLVAPEDSLDEHMEVEDAAMIDEAHYENEGDDFALAFNAATAGAHHEEAESTMIGSGPPERPSEPTDPSGGRGGPPDREDW
jgi:hypothetical protein